MATVIVAGQLRTGTSITTYIVKELGFDMGFDDTFVVKGKERYQINAVDTERRSVVEMVQEYLYQGGTKKDLLKKYRKLVKENEDKDWGWKFPYAGYILPMLVEETEEPYVILVWRHPFSSLKSQQKRYEERQEIHKELKNYCDLYRTVLDCKCPILNISCEDIQENPDREIDRIKDFLWADGDNEKIKKFLKL